ncbi:MAG: LamG domain-containing protein, partial [Candidatus Omnitrophica bacterium]|nr:LamG domain-containing protein [Candidatus Omnitrophota bacterium]
MKKSIGVLVTFLLVFLVFSPTHAGMNDGLVAYWPFNGNANDESGNGNNGVVSNATLTTDRLGNSNQAYSFNGSNSYVDLPSLYAYSPTYLTLHAWVKYDSDATGRKVIIAKLTGQDTPGNLALEIRGNVIAMQLNRDGSRVWHQALGSTPLAGDRWYHVAATYDGSHIKVFLNGVLDGSTPYSQGIPIDTIPWMIGVHPRSGGGFFDGFSFKGTIDDVGIYGRALSDAEIRELYEGTAPPPPADTCVEPPSGLVSWWPADGNADDIQNGNDGMLQGGVTFAPGKVGQAFSFDGVDDFVKIPASANLDVGLGSGFTLDAWIKPTDVGYRPIFEWNNGQGQFGPGVVFWIVPTGALATALIDTANTSRIVQTSGGIVQTGVWQHVALTYEKQNGIAKIYLNGNLVGQWSVGTFTPQTSYDLYLGHRPPISVPHENRYAGLIDEAEVFNRALSAEEIQAIYLAGSAGMCKAPADTTAPTTTATPSPGPNVNGWNNT